MRKIRDKYKTIQVKDLKIGDIVQNSHNTSTYTILEEPTGTAVNIAINDNIHNTGYLSTTTTIRKRKNGYISYVIL